ncbi:MFS transporter [Thermotoga neapolitana]|uniref:Sugar:cation symporter family protein n=1 Tax=Thermotoga neapolitana (strain ATCC 49049 / DSM 4359 / NBRC 107923 / NS-E) TaxID=309803 RepID=B9K9T3_THENN|nr:glycoside-pentoside-hexuronide (GPH):cation symporter [Thermotoga neapolitana]ACM23716.1 Sugar:cation symporter family protein [Thermotoga neapolitana DSM 4359]KFZ21330.1 Sugar:cation symporter family protein [Thermotoga neapolitana LA10]MDK2785680.1 oligogalacturonide transporter [Thermotoga sp.]HBF10220.1 MFS transporter [Thermotoga neapolitana]
MKKVGFKNILLYGLGDIFGGGSFVVIGTLFLLFLTDIVGLNPTLAGLVLIVGKIWDALSDPLMGYISDNTKSRFGRRRIYFLIGIIPIFISFSILWYPFISESQIRTFLYYLFAYIFFSTVYTMVMVPYSALVADMSRDYRIRTRLSGARMIFSQLSALISGTIPKLIVDSASTPAEGYFRMGIIFGIIYASPWLFVFLGTKEETRTGTIQKVSGNLFSVFKNRVFRTHIAMYISAYTAMDIMMALLIYYLTYYLNKEHMFSLAMGSVLITQIIFLPLYVRISNVFGQAVAYRTGLSLWGAGMILLSFLSSNSPTSLILIDCVIIGAGLSAGVMIPWAMLPTVADVDELITSENRAGLYSGMMTLIRKLVQAFTLFMIGVALDLIGYTPNVSQTPQTLLGMKILVSYVPIALILIGIIFSFKYKITPEIHRVLVQELKRLKETGDKSSVNDEVKKMCEEVTDIPYENLWKKPSKRN